MLGGFWSVPMTDCTVLTTDEICENSILERLLVNFLSLLLGFQMMN